MTADDFSFTASYYAQHVVFACVMADAAMLDRVIRKLTPVAHDVDGFRVFCREANIAWMPYVYVSELAAAGGPFPRRQDRRLRRCGWTK